MPASSAEGFDAPGSADRVGIIADELWERISNLSESPIAPEPSLLCPYCLLCTLPSLPVEPMLTPALYAPYRMLSVLESGRSNPSALLAVATYSAPPSCPAASNPSSVACPSLPRIMRPLDRLATMLCWLPHAESLVIIPLVLPVRPNVAVPSNSWLDVLCLLCASCLPSSSSLSPDDEFSCAGSCRGRTPRRLAREVPGITRGCGSVDRTSYLL